MDIASNPDLVSQYTEEMRSAAAPLKVALSTSRPSADNASFMEPTKGL
ncbi:MAG: hypothetical protein FWE96_04890 [Coriobacteriia bacterium]|nr:hypothetical protein [Coriobacteriia bacterium]